jgi:class 3 adenylate cyclase
MNKSIERALLFANIADNTGLLERLGQARALDVLSQCLARLFDIERNHGGNFIKAIGDGAICRFANFEDAVRAACRMHEALENRARVDRMAPATHIGVH